MILTQGQPMINSSTPNKMPDKFNLLFSEIEDPRIDRHKMHSLEEIIFLSLVATICGYDSWRGMVLFGKIKIDLLRQYLPYPNGIPSFQTISRVFSLIKPTKFEQAFITFVKGIFDKKDDEIIAIDGKTLRGSFDKEKGQKSLHLLHVWAVKNGICLAQLPVDEKTNEITVVPQILDCLDIAGSTVTSDALNCQKDIADKIIQGKADYVLAVKGNQKTLSEAIEKHFEENLPQDSSHNFYETTEKSHGRVEHRRYYTLEVANSWLPQKGEWKGLSSVGLVISNVLRNSVFQSEARFYICSFASDVQRFATCCRAHWSVENSLHWVLDVTFDEDASRKRKDHSPRNFALVRKIALNLIKKDPDKKTGIKLKRMRAAIDPGYLSQLLVGQGN